MESFAPYNHELVTHFNDISGKLLRSKVTSKFLGGDYLETRIRELISLATLRKTGAFFTGDALALDAVSAFSEPLNENSVVLDPACGAGNLLLVCSRQLAISSSLTETLVRWSKRLKGIDLHESFVRATRLRLILEALNRGAYYGGESLGFLENLLAGSIVQGDGLDRPRGLEKLTHVIMNPPYTRVTSPKTCTWTSGLVNHAAIFMDTYLSWLPDKTHLVAILPEVLRSGQRYAKWRDLQASRGPVAYDARGRFNKKTDIDVFIFSTTLRHGQSFSVNKLGNQTPTLGDRFQVSIGPVVPHRHPDLGERTPYIYSRMLPKWGTLSEVKETRGFSGRLEQPPFVVVRRTSSPSDLERCIGTIIDWDRATAVENHLVILSPKSGGLAECQGLLAVLKQVSTSDFLNKILRLRHLTVGAIKSIPWKES